MSINDEFTPPTIIDYDYYVSQYILPVVDNVAEQKRLIERWIIQCSDQIDVLCGGRVYEEFPTLDFTKDKDKKRAYYLRKAICSLLEYYIDTGKAFVDKNFSSASNVPANINASSEDANFEHKRKDIIKLLTQGNWYQTFNSYTNALDLNTCSQLHYDFDYDDLVDRLSEVFKRLDNKNSFNTNQVLNNYNLTHIKDLVGYNVNTSYIRNFKLDSSVDVSKVVKVSTNGTSSVKANFITINGVEWFLGGGGGLVTDIKQNGESVLDFQTGVADIDAYPRNKAQTKVYYGLNAPENPQDNDIWVQQSMGSAPAQIQSDWEQTDENAVDYIKNKPSVVTTDTEQTINNTKTFIDKINVRHQEGTWESSYGSGGIAFIENDTRYELTFPSKSGTFATTDDLHLYQHIVTASQLVQGASHNGIFRRKKYIVLNNSNTELTEVPANAQIVDEYLGYVGATTDPRVKALILSESKTNDLIVNQITLKYYDDTTISSITYLENVETTITDTVTQII